MATKSINWNKGGGAITVTYNGDGDGTISFSSVVNEGCDRTQSVTVSNNYGNSVVVTITQIGLREPFLCSDGEFLCSDGDTFNVLKQ